MQPTTLIFEHITKSGGTTFHQAYVPLAFARAEIFIATGTAPERVRDLARLAALSPDERARLRFITAHGVDGLRGMFPRASFLSLVRDSVQRVTSSYLHAKYYQGVSDLEFDAFLENRADIWFPNAYSGTLLGADCYNLSPTEMLHRLNERYAIIGITERYSAFLLYLHRKYGLPLALFNNHMVRPERAALDISEDQRRTIRKRNSLDDNLYEICNRQFELNFREIGDADDIQICDIYDKCRMLFSSLTNNSLGQKIRLATRPIALPEIKAHHESLLGLHRASNTGSPAIELPPATFKAVYNGQIQRDEREWQLVTDPAPWGYSAIAPIEIPQNSTQLSAVRATLHVERGTLGIGWESNGKWAAVASIESSQTPSSMLLVIPPGSVTGSLVFFNWGADGQRTYANISKVEILTPRAQ